MSPVPGGRSSSRTSRSPQKTSARNCCSARCSIGPRQTTASLPAVNIPIEMTFTPVRLRRHDHVVDPGRAGGDPEHPRHRVAVDVGVDHPDRQPAGGQRRGQVHRDRRLADPALARRHAVHARQRAGLGERDDGLGRAAAEVLAASRRAARRLITSRSTRTAVTPGTRDTASVTPRGDRLAHRAAGDGEVDADVGDAVGHDDALDHAQLGDRPVDLGVLDGGQRRVHGLLDRAGRGVRTGGQACCAFRRGSWRTVPPCYVRPTAGRGGSAPPRVRRAPAARGAGPAGRRDGPSGPGSPPARPRRACPCRARSCACASSVA